MVNAVMTLARLPVAAAADPGRNIPKRPSVTGRQGCGSENLRGFKAGLEDRSKSISHGTEGAPTQASCREKPRNDLATLENEIRETMPETTDFMIQVCAA